MIVCLAWGSLIWDLGGLPVEKLEGGLPVPRWVLSPEGEDIGDWKPDGPQVRVEFARQSGKERDRLTLVLHDAAERQPSLWARMAVATCQGRSKIRPPWRRKTRPLGSWVEWRNAAVRRGRQDAGVAAAHSPSPTMASPVLSTMKCRLVPGRARRRARARC